MEDLAFNTARWVFGQALAPFSSTVLKAWAASKDLGTSVKDLKDELLYVESVLAPNRRKDPSNNEAMEELLRRLQGHAYAAEDVLDLLDYFRIQDELDGTADAADEHPKGCAHDLVLNTRHTAIAVGRRLCWLPRRASASASGGAATAITSSSSTPDTKVNHGCMRKLITTSGCCFSGKPFTCSPEYVSSPSDDGAHSGGQSVPQIKPLAEGTPKLKFDRVSVSEKIKFITQQLQSTRENVSNMSNMLKIIDPVGQNVTPANAFHRPNTISESTEPKLYGRDQMMHSIINDITQGKYCGRNLTVLPIVGPGGIGKTTLMQHLYQDQKVQKHFDVKVWVCVSVDFNVDKITEDILGQICKENKGEENGNSRDLIRQRLETKRLLLVLDDIWEFNHEDHWKRLLLPFQKLKKTGNIILVTTRIPKTALTINKIDRPIELVGLDPAEFKELFLAFVFGDDEQSRKDNICLVEETWDKIAAKLKGSPLAAKTVGRLLGNNLNLHHWTTVLDSKEWELEKSEHDIMPALKFSYDYLQFHLKQCFLYCALFPQDYEFERAELISFWIGLDILHSGDDQHRPIEDRGLNRLNDLVSYGFLKREEKYGRTSYLMHDLLHDLAVRVASLHECLVIDRSNNMRSTEIKILPYVRHLSVIMGRHEDDETAENFINKFRKLETTGLKTESLRTLIVFGESDDERFGECFDDLITKANGLRVLHLSQMNRPHIQFAELPHLRYLRIGETNRRQIIHLPRMLSRFYHLIILDLKALWVEHDLPRDMSNNLTKLRHCFLSFDNCSKICNVGKLRSLQELIMRFEVNKQSNGFEVEQLGDLAELRELGMYNLERLHTEEEALKAQLKEKNYLHKLTLVWGREIPDKCDIGGVILEKLQPGSNLQELHIRGHGGRFCPTWLGRKLYVTALHLHGVEWEDLAGLGHLLCLRWLNISRCPKVKSLPPVPWTRTLESVSITNVEASLVREMEYTKSPSKLSLKMTENRNGDDQPATLYSMLVPSNLAHLQDLTIDGSDYATGKEVSQLLRHLPKLSELTIRYCRKIVRLGVEVDQDKEEENSGKEDDGLLVFPAHLSDSLQKLVIYGFRREARLLSAASSCHPFPSSLQHLELYDVEGMMGRLDPLSNHRSLTRLSIRGFSRASQNLTGEGLWNLLAHGQLSELKVESCPMLFASCMRWLQDDAQELQQLLRRSTPKLQELWIDDITGFLAAPICSLLSSSLTKLDFCGDKEMERLTEDQEKALQLLTSLQFLGFWLCDRLRCLPAGLQTLANLKSLQICYCPAISSLPMDGLPNSLQELEVHHCGMELEQQCKNFVRGHPTIKLSIQSRG